MKRLLLPLLAAFALPTAVNANLDPKVAEMCMKAVDFQGCVKAMTGKASNNNNIEVETDLGEKYIVKESAVTVSNYSWDKKVRSIELLINMWRDSFNSCLNGLSNETCSQIYLSNLDEKKANLEKAKKWRDKPKSLIMIKFRPIFIDLNNQKIAKNYETIYCMNPNLSISDQKEVLFAGGVDVPNKDSSLAFEITKSEVCEKYAKF